MESAPQGTQSPAEFTVNVTSTGRARPVTSPTAETTAEAPTTATATSLGKSCASATTAGKVRAGCGQMKKLIRKYTSQKIPTGITDRDVLRHVSPATSLGCVAFLLKMEHFEIIANIKFVTKIK